MHKAEGKRYRHNDTHLSRRVALTMFGLFAGVGATGASQPAAVADTIVPGGSDWRAPMGESWFRGEDYTVRPLQDGLEIWEGAHTGFAVVETATRTVLEGADDTPSPFWGVGGDLYYMGLASYFVRQDGDAVNLLSGNRLSGADVKAAAPDALAQVRDAVTQSRAAPTGNEPHGYRQHARC